jgi:hypothetical protein
MKVKSIHTEHTHTDILHCCPQNTGINTFGDCVLTNICEVSILRVCPTAIPD